MGKPSLGKLEPKPAGKPVNPNRRRKPVQAEEGSDSEAGDDEAREDEEAASGTEESD